MSPPSQGDEVAAVDDGDDDGGYIHVSKQTILRKRAAKLGVSVKALEALESSRCQEIAPTTVPAIPSLDACLAKLEDSCSLAPRNNPHVASGISNSSLPPWKCTSMSVTGNEDFGKELLDRYGEDLNDQGNRSLRQPLRTHRCLPPGTPAGPVRVDCMRNILPTESENDDHKQIMGWIRDRQRNRQASCAGRRLGFGDANNSVTKEHIWPHMPIEDDLHGFLGFTAQGPVWDTAPSISPFLEHPSSVSTSTVASLTESPTDGNQVCQSGSERTGSTKNQRGFGKVEKPPGVRVLGRSAGGAKSVEARVARPSLSNPGRCQDISASACLNLQADNAKHEYRSVQSTHALPKHGEPVLYKIEMSVGAGYWAPPLCFE